MIGQDFNYLKQKAPRRLLLDDRLSSVSDLPNHHFKDLIDSLATEGAGFVMQDRPGDVGGGCCGGGGDLEARDCHFAGLNQFLNVLWCNGFGIWIFICEIFFVPKEDDGGDQ
jgi:hypothetical protein